MKLLCLMMAIALSGCEPKQAPCPKQVPCDYSAYLNTIDSLKGELSKIEAEKHKAETDFEKHDRLFLQHVATRDSLTNLCKEYSHKAELSYQSYICTKDDTYLTERDMWLEKHDNLVKPQNRQCELVTKYYKLMYPNK